MGVGDGGGELATGLTIAVVVGGSTGDNVDVGDSKVTGGLGEVLGISTVSIGESIGMASSVGGPTLAGSDFGMHEKTIRESDNEIIMRTGAMRQYKEW